MTVILVKRVDLRYLVPSHETGSCPPHQPKPVPNLPHGLRFAEHVLLILKLGLLTRESEELGPLLKT